MPFKDRLHFFYSLVARACENSSIAARLIRSLNFRGKGLIVERIRSGAMCREVVTTCNGIRYRLDLRDDVQRELYFNIYEQKDLAQAVELIPSGGTCLDIGANNGVFALEFARKVGGSGIVHSFEPDPYIFSRLAYNSRLNNYENILICHQKAVSNIDGMMSFYCSEPEHSGWGSLVEFRDVAVRSEAVQTITLDSFLAKENISTVDFIKIDVEAHEPELLEGSSASLRNQVFRYVLIEFNGFRLASRGKTLDDFLKPFAAAGYAPVKLRLDMLKKMQNKTIPSESVCANFLFAPGSQCR